MAIFIPPSIRDKAIRDTLRQIALGIDEAARTGGGGGGDGNANLMVEANDPAPTDAGEVGDIIYSQNTDSIWIFQGTAWERASGGEEGADAIFTRIAVSNGLVLQERWRNG